MAIPKIFIFLTILSIISTTLSSAASSISPSPSVDCSNVILSLVDCLSYVSNGSTVAKPEAGCCSGLKTVLKTAPQCLCEGFKSSAQFGVVLDVPKALGLPSACHVSAPSVPNCKLSNDTGAAPVSSPTSSPTSTPTVGSPSTSEINEHAPTLAPANSGAPFLSISVLSVVVGMVLASSASF